MESKFITLAKILSFLNIYIDMYIYLYKTFSPTLDKGLRKHKKRDGEIGEHKLNKMGALNMK